MKRFLVALALVVAGVVVVARCAEPAHALGIGIQIGRTPIRILDAGAG